MNIKSGDTVVVISGANKGKSGKIQKAFPKTRKVIVEGVAMVKRHQKPRGQGMPGGIIEKEAAIPASNVMLLCPSCKKATRVAHKVLEDGSKERKVRACKKCGATFDN
ncbi:MAG: 50S ribosomal protein L24 [Clostridia bacterium]